MRLRILVPISSLLLLSTPAAAAAAFAHTVLPGESLYSIAAADGLSVAQLAAANGLSSAAPLIAGSTVLIPSQSGAGAASSVGGGEPDGDEGVAVASASAGYTVQPGDTLSSIAARAGTTVGALAAANGIDPNGVLVSGSTLRLSGSVAAASSQPVGAAAQGVASAPPYPTPERVTASEVGSIASANGVSPSLAAAVGWQESGFNNDLVSVAGARGVMQILPGTWDWIQRTLTAGTPLAPASAVDNVRGGVLLLRALLNSTGGDPGLAAAGYYQGLPSVRRYGLFPSTQRYVNSVLALRSRFGGP